MHFFRTKIEKLRIGWNERTLTEDDFHRLCRRFGIKVQEMPLRVCGFYYRVKGKNFFAIDSKLTGAKKLSVMFHELGHFLFHAPESGATANFHGVGHRTRKECEADVFALCAILPKEMISKRSSDELLDEGFEPEIIQQRYEIFKRFGL